MTCTTPRPRPATSRGTQRRRAIVAEAARLFARRGYAAVGMDDIGAAAGITGPAIYRYFDSKAAVLTAVIDGIIDAVAPPSTEYDAVPDAAGPADAAALLSDRIARYASAVAQRRRLMTVFVREVHHLPDEHRHRLQARQSALVTEWRSLLAGIHRDWPAEQVRTSVHGAFGVLNAVATFHSPLPDAALADQLVSLTVAALEVPTAGSDAGHVVTATGSAAARRT